LTLQVATTGSVIEPHIHLQDRDGEEVIDGAPFHAV
jgi:hypothetical protein